MGKISEIIDFNPTRAVKRGQVAPFIDMASLPTSDRCVSEIGHREFIGGGAKFKNGDTLFARITPCLENGKTAKVSGLPDGVSAHGSTEFIVMSAKEPDYDENFVYYLARLPEFRSFAISHMEGTSGRQRVSWQALERFEFSFPEKEDRKEAGDVLSGIDNKIELNQRMNETLEGMARAIFKSWFVDFDPVHAKAEGRDPEGMEAQTAALFPNSFTDDGLPEGWHIGKISDLCKKVESGGTPSRKEPSYWDDGNIPWLTSGEVRQTIVIKTENFITESGLQNSSAKLWPPLTTVVAMYGATAGQVTLLACETTANQACCALIPESHTASYIFLKAMNSVQIYEGKASGSAQQNLNKSIVSDLETLIPPKEILEKFEGIVAGLIAKMIANEKQNQTLAVLRDTLLPKLISGELRVGDVDTLIKEAL